MEEFFEEVSTPSLFDIARPVTLTRVMDQLADGDCEYHVPSAEEDMVVHQTPRYEVRIQLVGPFQAVLQAHAVVKASVAASLQADVTHAVDAANRENYWPTSYYRRTEENRLKVFMTAQRNVRAGLTDEQLGETLTDMLFAFHRTMVQLAQRVPELVGIPDGFTEGFGEKNSPIPAEVTLERLTRVLASDGVTNVAVDEEDMDVSFFLNHYFFVVRVGSGDWLTVRAYLNCDVAPYNYLQLAEAINEYNARGRATMATAVRVDDHYEVALEQHIPLDGGLTAGQLGLHVSQSMSHHFQAIEEISSLVEELRRAS